MAGINLNYPQRTSPAWLVDEAGPPNMVPAGGRVDPMGFAPNGQGRRYIPAGTLVGRTFAERTASMPFGPADLAVDEEIYLTVFDIPDAAIEADVDLLRHGRMVKENFLPFWSTATAQTKAKLRQLYQTTVGID